MNTQHIHFCACRLFEGTIYRDSWIIYHDALSSWWSKGAQRHMEQKGFGDRQVCGLGHTNAGNRYEGKLPGDTPEYMPLDSNLFADLETAVRFNVAATAHLPSDNPEKFKLGSPLDCWDAVVRTWEYAPTSDRIVEDIDRVFTAIDQVVDARGIAVDFKLLRHGRRLREHQDAAARKSRSQRRSDAKKNATSLDTITGLHPMCKQLIIDLCND